MAAMENTGDWEAWYYLGVAAYLQDLYWTAKEAHDNARALMIKDGVKALPATVDWSWMICMKLDLKEEAEKVLACIEPNLDMETEDGDYLCRVLLYKGVLKPEGFVDACMADIKNPERPRIYYLMLTYGLANYLHYQGRDAEAVPLLKEVAETGDFRNLFAVKEAMRSIPFFIQC